MVRFCTGLELVAFKALRIVAVCGSLLLSGLQNRLDILRLARRLGRASANARLSPSSAEAIMLRRGRFGCRPAGPSTADEAPGMDIRLDSRQPAPELGYRTPATVYGARETA